MLGRAAWLSSCVLGPLDTLLCPLPAAHLCSGTPEGSVLWLLLFLEVQEGRYERPTRVMNLGLLVEPGEGPRKLVSGRAVTSVCLGRGGLTAECTSRDGWVLEAKASRGSQGPQGRWLCPVSGVLDWRPPPRVGGRTPGPGRPTLSEAVSSASAGFSLKAILSRALCGLCCQ